MLHLSQFTTTGGMFPKYKQGFLVVHKGFFGNRAGIDTDKVYSNPGSGTLHWSVKNIVHFDWIWHH